MRRCFPPDRSIQGPDLVTVVIIASPSELLDSAGARLRRSAARTRFLFQNFFYLKTHPSTSECGPFADGLLTDFILLLQPIYF